jgi:CPA2 family monovalent cation:H+ antiporter-2
MHDISLISTIAMGLAAALAFGLLAKRLRLSPIVGYLVAGIAIIPHTPGLVGDIKVASQLAEIGDVLLMFGVGLHFHWKDLLAVRSIAVPGAIGQSLAATLACTVIAVALGWDIQSGMVLGIAVSVASTVVLLRCLMDHGTTETHEGHVAIGWLVVEDLLTVLVLVLLPALVSKSSDAGGPWLSLGIALLKIGVLVTLVFVVGGRFAPWLFVHVARLRSRELFTLTVLVFSISVATASYVVFGASMALGAFLAGMVVGQSKVSHQAAVDALPLRDAFAVLFFVSVGMLFNPRAVVDAPWLTVGVIAVILIVKPLVAFLIVLLGGHSLKTGLTVAGGLAQIGEFSFIVADLAGNLGLMPDTGRNALIAGAILSISLNPLLFRRLQGLEPLLARNPTVAWWLARRIQSREQGATTRFIPKSARDEVVRAVVVGYGPAGQTVTRLLRESGVVPTVVETNIDTVEELNAAGGQALFGDATRSEILKTAGLAAARYLIITVPKAETTLAVIQSGREVNPTVEIMARASYLRDRVVLEAAGAATICVDEAESAVALASVFLKRVNTDPERVASAILSIRSEIGGAG